MGWARGNLSPNRAGDKNFVTPRRLPIGAKILVAFFLFGVLGCILTIAALLVPGGPFAFLWELKPEAKAGFAEIGRPASVLLMLGVGLACGAAALGLARGRNWGRKVAICILAVNLAGDVANAALRRDPRTLVGLPVGGALLFYLARLGRKKSPPAVNGGM